MSLISKHKKKNQTRGNRVLVTITVLGSAGPMRFIVNELELVTSVISMVHKTYAKEGRLPLLGSNLDDFFLYSPVTACDALSPWETIGAHGGRNFIMCKKPQLPIAVNVESTRKNVKPTVASHDHVAVTTGKKGSLKAWINKSLISFKIPIH